MKWLLIAILLTGCEMRFEDVEMGGIENGPVNIETVGDKEKAVQYIRHARVVLGNLKQYMQLNEYTSLQTEVTLEDGTLIRAMSNTNGLTDIDRVLIDVRPPIRNPEEVHICIGYIVQTFTPDAYYHLTLPDETDVPFSSIYYNNKDADDVDPLAFDGFPDNGAKYIYSKDFWERTIDKDYQAVVVVNDHTLITYGGSPIVYTLSNPYPDPELNPGWIWVTEYMHSEGTCGYTNCGPGGSESPHLYSQTVNPCTSDFTGLVNVYEAYGRTTIPGFTYVDKVTWWVGPWAMDPPMPCFNDWAVLCYREAPDGSRSLQPLVDEVTPIAFAKRNTDFDGAAVALMNEASTQGFNYLMENVYITTDETQYKTDFLYTMKVGGIVKRTDDRGFFTSSGFYFDKDKIVLTEQFLGNGEYAVFMIPLNDKKRFRYSDELHQKVSDANANWDNGTVTFAAGRASIQQSPYCATATFGFTASPADSEGYIINASRTDFYEYDMQDLFGIPCKVDDGVHEVRVQSSLDGKVKVYALITGTDGQGMKIVESELKGDLESNIIRIKVGPYTDFSEVVKFS